MNIGTRAAKRIPSPETVPVRLKGAFCIHFSGRNFTPKIPSAVQRERIVPEETTAIMLHFNKFLLKLLNKR